MPDEDTKPWEDQTDEELIEYLEGDSVPEDVDMAIRFTLSRILRKLSQPLSVRKGLRSRNDWREKLRPRPGSVVERVMDWAEKHDEFEKSAIAEAIPEASTAAIGMALTKALEGRVIKRLNPGVYRWA